MPQRNHDADYVAVGMLADHQDGLVARAQLLELGIPPSTIAAWTSVTGPWRRILPGIYAVGMTPTTDRQLHRAALLYAGRGALLTGAAAAAMYGLRYVPNTGRTDVVIPHATHRTSKGHVVVQRTQRMPVAVPRDGFSCVPVGRAVIDTCRSMASMRDVRAVIAEAVQTGRCGLESLRTEVEDGPIRYSALCRQALDEVTAGPRSVPEIDARQLFRDCRLPEPMWNVDLYSEDGRWIACPDAYWDEGVAYEQDSREYHLSPEDWKQTMHRHARMTSYGILVVHAPPSRLSHDRAALASELRSALANAARGPRPPIITLSRAA